MEALILILFCLILISCIVFNFSILYALLFGLILFLIYGKIKGFNAKALFKMCLSGVSTIKNILLTFILIGILTATWRASGCIPSIVSYCSTFITENGMVIITFLLCTLVSVLTGTAFGTATTIGVICSSIAKSMGVPLFWIGGAILSGAYFGDRCSPVSTSALLVSTLTETNTYDNIKNMIKSCIVPFILTCIIYTIAGFTLPESENATDITSIFKTEFNISYICLIPAILILVCSFFKLGVKKLMGISIISAIPISIFLQHINPLILFKEMFLGYEATDPTLSSLIDGGGIFSMVKVSLIISIASCYSGIFKETGLLNFLTKYIDTLKEKTNSYFVYLITSLLLIVISCNQTLAIILTDQMVSHIEDDKTKKALYLEDTAVIIAPLIPWSIACTVPLATAEAPTSSILVACFLYLLPLYRLIKNRKY